MQSSMSSRFDQIFCTIILQFFHKGNLLQFLLDFEQNFIKSYVISLTIDSIVLNLVNKNANCIFETIMKQLY